MIDTAQEKITVHKKSAGIERWVIPAVQVISGSILLALVAQLSIPLPFTPVPISLQTFAIFLLALTLGSKKGTASVIAYLVQGTLGLPVFAGGLANTAWLMGPRAGYLIGFVLAAWIVGKLVENKPERSLLYTLGALLVGELAILVPGALWLAAFVGYGNAFALGVAPFLIGDMIKLVAAAFAFKPTMRLFARLFG